MLQACMTRTGPVASSEPAYNNQPANSINQWCQIYQTTLPCVTKYLPSASASNPNDWYLSLVYDQEYANKTSNGVCSRLKKYGNRMGCLTTDMNHAEIIPVTASRCFEPFFKTCRRGIRKLLSKYFMILSGKCLHIARKYQNVTTPKPNEKGEVTSAKPSEEEEDTEDTSHKTSGKDRTETSDNLQQHNIRLPSTAQSDDNDNTKLRSKHIHRQTPDSISGKILSTSTINLKHIKSMGTRNKAVPQIRPPFENVVKMRIIERVIHSDVETEPNQNSNRFNVVPVKHAIHVHEPFVVTKHRFEGHGQTTKPPKQIDNKHPDVSEVDEDEPSTHSNNQLEDNKTFQKIVHTTPRTLTPDIRDDSFFQQKPAKQMETTTVTLEKVTEDIYIEDSKILSAMKPLSEKEIDRPDEVKEVQSILTTFDNFTESSSSSEDDSVIDEPERSDSEDDSEISENDSVISENDSAISESERRTKVQSTVSSTLKIDLSNQVKIRTTTETFKSQKGSQKGGSGGRTLGYSFIVLVTLTVISVSIKTL
ncbi:unnamed protein product [Mytilus edulis]|uniref:Uncharacterized protein n=1 Tax=Mytilus edulis TaxID=6550 RepID=A0A8S3RQ68_MYTED|nr:unnamed protein product [Mytilus edulis]